MIPHDFQMLLRKFLVIFLMLIYCTAASDTGNTDADPSLIHSNSLLADSDPANDALVAGGFSPNSTTGECPSGYELRNQKCWIRGSPYYLQVQNKFMEDYDVDDDMKSVPGHRVVLTALTGENSVTGNMPVVNCTITVWHEGRESLTILLPDRTINLAPREELQLRTCARGRAAFTVKSDLESLTSSSPNHVFDFDLPPFRANAAFMNHHDTFAFAINTQALHEFANMPASKLLALMNSSDPNTANATVKTLQNMLLPFVHGSYAPADTSRIHKRSLLEDEETTCDRPYFPPSNLVLGDRVHRYTRLRRRFYPDVSPSMWEVRFDSSEQGAEFIVHDDDKSDGGLKKRDLVHIYRRAYAQELWNKIKTATKSTGRFMKSLFVEVPKSFFNISAWKNGSHAFLESVQAGVSNATKKGLVMTNDMFKVLPLGERISKGLGIDELVNRVAESQSIFVTPLTYGLEIFILGPKNATAALVTEMKELGGILKGIFKRVGVTLKEVFKFILSLFKWSDILINHRVLSSHYEKMIPFIRNAITNRKGNLTADIGTMIDRFGEFTQNATDIVATGNFSSMADLIGQANREVFRNLTKSPEIKQNGHNGPIDIQGSFITDHLTNAASTNNIEVDVSEDEQREYIDVVRNIAEGFEDIVRGNATDITMEFKVLIDEFKARRWDWRAILQSINRIIQYTVRLIIIKAMQIVLVYLDLFFSLMNKLMSLRINVPFLTAFYENVLIKKSGKLTMYDLFSLTATTPLTITFKMFNDGRNLFTPQEANVLIATSVPEYYVDNLVSFAMQAPNQNATLLRNMYRRTVSYILGAGFSAGQLIGATMGLLTGSWGILFLLRSPFEFLSIMCNYPWSWYTDSLTQIGVNIRFISWMTWLISFIIGWYAKWPTGAGLVFSWICLLASAIPNLVAIIRVWLQDLRVLKSDNVEGQSSIDITLKGIGRLMNVVPHLVAVVPQNMWQTMVADRVGITVFQLTAATIQTARLYLVDIPLGVIYSV